MKGTCTKLMKRTLKAMQGLRISINVKMEGDWH